MTPELKLEDGATEPPNPYRAPTPEPETAEPAPSFEPGVTEDAGPDVFRYMFRTVIAGFWGATGAFFGGFVIGAQGGALGFVLAFVVGWFSAIRMERG